MRAVYLDVTRQHVVRDEAHREEPASFAVMYIPRGLSEMRYPRQTSKADRSNGQPCTTESISL